MKVRIKFQKYGAMKFIGHLDVMRYFQKVFRRAGIDNEYTKGYSPHQIMSFAAPLGVGLTSDSEYVDVQLLSSDAPVMMIERINSVLTEGFRITGYHFLLEREEHKKTITAMSLVSAADYLVSLKDGYEIDTIGTQEEFQNKFMVFLSGQEIVIDKKTKTSEKSVDIKPMITFAAFSLEEYEKKRRSTQDISGIISKEEVRPKSVADIYDNGIKVYLQIDTGSSVNLKPELVMEAFCNYLEVDFKSFAWQVHRLEIYSRDEGSGKRIPLDKLER